MKHFNHGIINLNKILNFLPGISSNKKFYSITLLPPGAKDVFDSSYTSSGFSVTLLPGNNYSVNINFTLNPQSNPANVNLPQNTTTPDEFHLNQNYPNTFHLVVNTGFSIPKKSNVKLTVFDLSVREIPKPAGMSLAARYWDVRKMIPVK
jgi:hypothetical protein